MNTHTIRPEAIVALLATSGILCACMQPAPPRAAGREEIRVLIVDGFSNHNWQQTTRLTRNILESSGLFAVDVSTAPPTQASRDGIHGAPLLRTTML